MADLTAQGPDPDNRWQRPLARGAVTLGRRRTHCDWEVPWDLRISSLHAVLTWEGDHLRVRRVAAPEKNAIYYHGQDQGFNEFTVRVGEAFVIGDTSFLVLGDGPAPPPPRPRRSDLPPSTEMTCTQQELHQTPYVDADQRIDALAALPGLIRVSLGDDELARKVGDVLLQGIPRAEVAAVVRVATADNSAKLTVKVHALASRSPTVEPFQPSRRLVADALRRGQSVFYSWGPDADAEFTANGIHDWAFFVPLPQGPELSSGLYAAGFFEEQAQRAAIPFTDLLKSDLKFAQVVADIYHALRQVRELQAEQVQIHTSLRLAQEVQAGFFPRVLPQVPGYELVASTRSAEATGGDYYDVIPLPSGKLGLVIADVSGHGLGPSLHMASLRALLRGLARRGEVLPEEMLTDLNLGLRPDLKPRRFITIVYGVLDPKTHQFCYANAGHGPVVLHLPAREDRWRSLVDDARGCPVGIADERYQACCPVKLAPGDLFILGSDGVVETRRGSETFGVERLQQVVVQHRQRRLQEIHDAVLKATLDWHDGPSPDDDLTLLLVRRA
jgi:serine phosphatase RsbU (regulator of sigma subunit)